MATVYATGDFIRLEDDKQPTSSDVSEHTFPTKKEKDRSYKAVLPAVLSVCLLGSLLALCVLGIFYSKQQLRSSNLLKEQCRNDATNLDVQEQNATDSTFKRSKYYYFSSEKLNWMESQHYCVKTGGQLVTIKDKDDQNYLVSVIKETHWIGLHDLYTEGHWMWVDNSSLSGETFWHNRSAGLSEPDNWTHEDSDGEDCACLGTQFGYVYEWFDASCAQLKKFICEK